MSQRNGHQETLVVFDRIRLIGAPGPLLTLSLFPSRNRARFLRFGVFLRIHLIPGRFCKMMDACGAQVVRSLEHDDLKKREVV